MVFRFKGTQTSNTVNLVINNQLVGICNKNQLLVDPNSDYINCEIIDLEGESVDMSKFLGFYFIAEKDTTEFIKTRLFDFKNSSKQKLSYDC